MPSGLGYYIYHKIQKATAKKIDTNITVNKKSFETIYEMLQKHGETLTGKNILEIGSGWIPLMPYILKHFGNCNNVYTYDINEHYDKVNIAKLTSYFNAEYKTDFISEENSKYGLPDFVKYYPKNDVSTTSLPGRIDIVFSRFVLEHVSPAAILAMHQKFYEKFDRSTIILHLISPSDHRAYSDASLSHYDFLQYSQQEWNKIQTKFDYHNRLRLPQYLEIFEQAGFEVVELEFNEVNKASKKYEDFKKLKLHSDYAKFAEKELLAGSINILLKKK